MTKRRPITVQPENLHMGKYHRGGGGPQLLLAGRVLAKVTSGNTRGAQARALKLAHLFAAAPALEAALRTCLAELVQYMGANEPGGSMERARIRAMRRAEEALASALAPRSLPYKILISKDPRVASFNAEHGDEDWWIYLRPGWRWEPGMHIIHEQTLAECYAQLQEVTRCDCQDCKPARKGRRKAV